MLNRNKTALLV